jgi:4-hydroxy-tetrahydrodipicolinate synthase
MQIAKIKGVIPPVPTIVDQDGAFDRHGMASLIERVVGTGVNGMLILGSGGEFCHMSMAARKEVAEFAIRQVAGRLPVLIGIGACGTAEVIELGRHAAAVGADAVLAVNPYYAMVSQEALFQHYERISHALELPVLLYNFPGLTGQDLGTDLVKRLAFSCPNIVGIKDTVDTISHTRQILTEVKPVRPDFLVFSGYDEYLLDTLILGGDGGIPATSNYAPDICCGIYRAFLDKDFDKIVLLERRLAKLMPIYALDMPYFGLVKEAIRLTGSDISTAVLPPAQPPTMETKVKLVEVLKRSGVLPAS